MTVLEDEEPIEYDDETDAEREARLEFEFEDDISPELVTMIVEKVLIFIDEFSGIPLYPYQVKIARRIVESVVIGDGATITALQARQSGKSEVVANTLAALMVILPVLAKVFPDTLEKFKRGFWVGSFAPTDDQAEIVYSRIVSRLTSDRAQEVYEDPDLQLKIKKGHGNTMILSNGSLLRRQTAHPRSNIEGRTYHLMLIDECQDADARVINKSIGPMGASTNATMVFIGTPSYTKGAFYSTIQANKRNATKRGQKENHFEIKWREVARYNKNYGKFVKKEMLRIGEDSDEFKLAYECTWMLDKGMFTTQERIEDLGDKSMEVLHAWHKTPVVVGIDPARKQDSTIVTVLWVDWDHPDEFGFYECRILNWLDLTGLGWEEQYARIQEFLSNYLVLAVAVDEGGLGDPVISRLRVMFPNLEIKGFKSDRGHQSDRWKHLYELLQRGRIGWPAHAKTRRLKVWKRFTQQMEDLELKYEGPYMIAAAPRAADAHDDYMDSLNLATILTKMDMDESEVEVAVNPFYNR